MKDQRVGKAFVLLLCGLLAISLALGGCGGENTSGTTQSAGTLQTTVEETAAPRDVALTIWTGPDWKGVFSPEEENAKDGDWFRYVAKDFIAANAKDKLTVNVEVLAYADIVKKLNIAIASNTAPDLWSYSQFNIYPYISQGTLLPLDDIITPEAKSNMQESLWPSVTADGKVYLYPFAAIPTCLAVNKTMFEKAGLLDKLPLDSEDRTWTNEEFKEALQAITKNGTTAHYGLGLFASNNQFDTNNFCFMWSYGARTFSEDLSKITLNDENGVKALEFLVSLIKEKLTVPSPATISWNDTYNLFLQQQVAFIAGATTSMGRIQEAFKQPGMTPFDVELVMIPSSDGKPKTVSYIYALCAFKTNDEARMEYAKKYIAFAANPDYAKGFKNLGIPANKQIADINDDKYEYKVTKSFLKYDTDLGARAEGYAEIRNAFFPALQAAFIGSKTPKQALDDFAKESEDIMAKYK